MYVWVYDRRDDRYNKQHVGGLTGPHRHFPLFRAASVAGDRHGRVDLPTVLLRFEQGAQHLRLCDTPPTLGLRAVH